MATHYETLGVGEHSPAEHIRAAYIALMREIHPDSAARHPVNSRRPCACQANAAYAVLRDRAARACYDRQLAQTRYPGAALERLESTSPFELAAMRTRKLFALLLLVVIHAGRPRATLRQLQLARPRRL